MAHGLLHIINARYDPNAPMQPGYLILVRDYWNRFVNRGELTGRNQLHGIVFAPIYDKDGVVGVVGLGTLRMADDGKNLYIHQKLDNKETHRRETEATGTYRTVFSARASWKHFVESGWTIYPEPITLQGSPEGWESR